MTQSKLPFTMTYAELIADENEPDLLFREPLFHVIGLSTCDSVGKSIPILYFITIDTELPMVLKRNNRNARYVKLNYNTVSEELQQWLHTNASHSIRMDTIVDIMNEENDDPPHYNNLIDFR